MDRATRNILESTGKGCGMGDHNNRTKTEVSEYRRLTEKMPLSDTEARLVLEVAGVVPAVAAATLALQVMQQCGGAVPGLELIRQLQQDQQNPGRVRRLLAGVGLSWNIMPEFSYQLDGAAVLLDVRARLQPTATT